MQGLVDIITNVTNSIRFVISLFFLCILAIVLMITASATFVAPQAAQSLADTAEKVTDKAVEARNLEMRNRAYANEGWGYSEDAAVARAEADEMAREFENDLNGWGE